MEEENIMYQIKILEKYITRFLMKDLKKDIAPPTQSQMQIMEYILNHEKEDLHQKDLESILHLRRATVSGILHTMEKNHFIKRVTDECDARQKRIILHEDAKKCFLLHLKKVKEMKEVLTENLTQEEKTTFMEILKKMQNNIKERTKENA